MRISIVQSLSLHLNNEPKGRGERTLNSSIPKTRMQVVCHLVKGIRRNLFSMLIDQENLDRPRSEREPLDAGVDVSAEREKYDMLANLNFCLFLLHDSYIGLGRYVFRVVSDATRTSERECEQASKRGERGKCAVDPFDPRTS